MDSDIDIRTRQKVDSFFYRIIQCKICTVTNGGIKAMQVVHYVT